MKDMLGVIKKKKNVTTYSIPFTIKLCTINSTKLQKKKKEYVFRSFKSRIEEKININLHFCNIALGILKYKLGITYCM